MATDQNDKKTRSLQLERRGRPAKHGTAMTAAERAAAHRARQKARGLKQVTVWVPEAVTPAQAQEAVNKLNKEGE